mmetsp:Transcript_12517/g.18744  ORF Transcript_12517/g.18744 Transcript_12517/m.18744 type:complete len:197 (+) Transcript_12517:714-1304(+)
MTKNKDDKQETMFKDMLKTNYHNILENIYQDTYYYITKTDLPKVTDDSECPMCMPHGEGSPLYKEITNWKTCTKINMDIKTRMDVYEHDYSLTKYNKTKLERARAQQQEKENDKFNKNNSIYDVACNQSNTTFFSALSEKTPRYREYYATRFNLIGQALNKPKDMYRLWIEMNEYHYKKFRGTLSNTSYQLHERWL